MVGILDKMWKNSWLNKAFAINNICPIYVRKENYIKKIKKRYGQLWLL